MYYLFPPIYKEPLFNISLKNVSNAHKNRRALWALIYLSPSPFLSSGSYFPPIRFINWAFIEAEMQLYKQRKACCCSVAQSCPTPCDRTDCNALLPLSSAVSWVCLSPCPQSRWCYLTISSSASPCSFCLQYFPASGSFPIVGSLHQVAIVLEFHLQHHSFQWTPRTDLLQNGLAGSPCSPRDSQESSPTPQFKSINSSVLSFPYSPTLTSIHDILAYTCINLNFMLTKSAPSWSNQTYIVHLP